METTNADQLRQNFIQSLKPVEDPRCNICTICMELYYEPDHVPVTAPCRHQFGLSCAIEWYDENKKDCPVCHGRLVVLHPYIDAPEELTKSRKDAAKAMDDMWAQFKSRINAIEDPAQQAALRAKVGNLEGDWYPNCVARYRAMKETDHIVAFTILRLQWEWHRVYCDHGPVIDKFEKMNKVACDVARGDPVFPDDMDHAFATPLDEVVAEYDELVERRQKKKAEIEAALDRIIADHLAEPRGE